MHLPLCALLSNAIVLLISISQICGESGVLRKEVCMASYAPKRELL